MASIVSTNVSLIFSYYRLASKSLHACQSVSCCYPSPNAPNQSQSQKLPVAIAISSHARLTAPQVSWSRPVGPQRVLVASFGCCTPRPRRSSQRSQRMHPSIACHLSPPKTSCHSAAENKLLTPGAHSAHSLIINYSFLTRFGATRAQPVSAPIFAVSHP